MGSMFQVKNGQDYRMFKNINPDPFTWKEQDMVKAIKRNQHDMVELVVDISDVELKGSSSSVDKMAEVISTFKLTLDTFKIKKDAYASCKKNARCSKVVSDTDADILNYLYQDAYN